MVMAKVKVKVKVKVKGYPLGTDIVLCCTRVYSNPGATGAVACCDVLLGGIRGHSNLTLAILISMAKKSVPVHVVQETWCGCALVLVNTDAYRLAFGSLVASKRSFAHLA